MSQTIKRDTRKKIEDIVKKLSYSTGDPDDAEQEAVNQLENLIKEEKDQTIADIIEGRIILPQLDKLK